MYHMKKYIYSRGIMGREKKNISKNEMFAEMGITYFKKLAPYKGKIPCNETPFHYIMKI